MMGERFLLVELNGEEINHVAEVDSEDAVPEMVLGVDKERDGYVLKTVELSHAVPSVEGVKMVFWIGEGHSLVATKYLLLRMAA